MRRPEILKTLEPLGYVVSDTYTRAQSTRLFCVYPPASPVYYDTSCVRYFTGFFIIFHSPVPLL